MTERRTGEPLAIEELKLYPYFNRLSESVLRKVALHVERQALPPGTLILRHGDYSDAAYFIAQGAVEVRVPGAPPRSPGVAGSRGAMGAAETVRLSAGEIFGELGALSRYPTTADVVAADNLVVLRIATPALRMLLKQQVLTDFSTLIDDRYRTRALASHLRHVDLFAEAGDDVIDRLREAAELRSYDPGDVIIAEGASDAALYLVRGGHVRVSMHVPAAPGGRAAVTYLKRGDCTGEDPLLTGAPWPWSLEALEHVEIVRLPQAAIRPWLDASPKIAERLRATADADRRLRARVAGTPAVSAPLEMAMDLGLINGQSVLLIDLRTCTGCDDCVRACADTHGGRPRFVRQGARFEQWSLPLACYQCTDPVCMVGCPTGAVTRPLGGFAVAIDDETCIGCGNCASRCPWQNILTVPYQSTSLGRSIALATKCDACHGRAAGPACVQMCPHGSAMRLSFQDPDAVAALLGTRTATGAPT